MEENKNDFEKIKQEVLRATLKSDIKIFREMLKKEYEKYEVTDNLREEDKHRLITYDVLFNKYFDLKVEDN